MAHDVANRCIVVNKSCFGKIEQVFEIIILKRFANDCLGLVGTEQGIKREKWYSLEYIGYTFFLSLKFGLLHC